MKNNSTIYNYKREKNKIIYSTPTDSLGKYLFPIEEDKCDNKLKFNQFKDSIVITEYFNGLESGEFEAYSELSNEKIEIEFDRKIKSFTSDFTKIKKVDKKTLELIISDREYSYGKGSKKIVVKF